MAKFPSDLPGGNRQQQGRISTGCAILDTIYSEAQRKFYILDIMMWVDSYYDCDTEFR